MPSITVINHQSPFNPQLNYLNTKVRCTVICHNKWVVVSFPMQLKCLLLIKSIFKFSYCSQQGHQWDSSFHIEKIFFGPYFLHHFADLAKLNFSAVFKLSFHGFPGDGLFSSSFLSEHTPFFPSSAFLFRKSETWK